MKSFYGSQIVRATDTSIKLKPNDQKNYFLPRVCRYSEKPCDMNVRLCMELSTMILISCDFSESVTLLRRVVYTQMHFPDSKWENIFDLP